MGWIKCSDRLPKEHEWILFASSKNNCVEMGIYMNGKFVLPDLHYMERKETTHWMPLPVSPKE